MNLHRTPSGLLLATDKPIEPPKPPEHPVRAVIREHLAKMADELGRFEQTTHGRIRLAGDDIEQVGDELANCYSDPTAFRISELSQSIRSLLKEAEKK